MNKKIKEELKESIREFHLPRYHEIPDVGLYLEQVTKYLNEYLAPLEDISITPSMISNYVKKGLVSNPVKKQYNREQIAYLMFIAVAKSVVSLEDIGLAVNSQKKTYTLKVAYNYFCQELENILQVVFGMKESLDTIGVDNTDEKVMLRNLIITVAHKVYLDMYFTRLHEEQK